MLLSGRQESMFAGTPTRARRRALRVALVVVALAWTQFPLGSGASAEGGRAIELCCAWGRTLSDGDLTWTLTGADSDTAAAIRAAVAEWDSTLAISLTAVPPETRKVDIRVVFAPSDRRTEGQAVTSFTQRGLIRKVDVNITGAPGEPNRGALVAIAKHEFGHALGLGHANHEGNLMSEAVSPAAAPIPGCVVTAVKEANRWEMFDPQERNPQRPDVNRVDC